ncbi:MAG: sulfatase-like hydrolase/transferase, partial [Planctomycetota bacterium]
RSAAVGKWHLGLGDGAIDWNKPISPGPREIGFDESFLIPATGDRVPCVYVENQLVVGLQSDDPITVSFQEQVGNDPTGLDQPELLKMKWHHGHNATIVNGISRIGFMAGGKTARWIDEDMADVITTKAVNFIDRHMAAHRSQPFFLYFNPHDIHVPRVPHPRFIGSTSMGPRGDAIAELDWCVGEILNSLDQHGISKNTIVLFTSDNGPVLNDGYVDEAVDRAGEHRPAGPFRGGKYSAFEAGTRVPFLIRWPVRIAGGSTSDALVCQIDLLRSMASLLQHSLPQDAAPDSLDALNALLGTDAAGRDHLVEQAGTLALRQGTWKLIMPGKGPAVSRQVNIETGNSPEVQLYDLSADPGETENVAGQNSDRVREMIALLESIQKNGTPR